MKKEAKRQKPKKVVTETLRGMSDVVQEVYQISKDKNLGKIVDMGEGLSEGTDSESESSSSSSSESNDRFVKKEGKTKKK